MIFSLLRKTALPVMVIIFKIHRRWINKRYITASRCPMYRWSIFAARSTRLTAWNASCLLPLLLNVKQHLFLSAKPNKWKSCVGNVWLTIPNLPSSGIKTARPSPNFYRLWGCGHFLFTKSWRQPHHYPAFTLWLVCGRKICQERLFIEAQCGWLCNRPYGSSTSKSICYDNGG